MLVKPQFIRAVLAFDLSVMPRCCDANPMILNSHVDQCLLKQRLMLGLCNQQCVGEFCSIVRLDHSDRKRCIPDQFLQKVLCAYVAVLVVHFTVCPSRTFVLCRKLIVLSSIGNAVRRNKLHIYLELLSGVFCPLIRLIFSFPPLFLRLDKLRRGSFEAAIASAISICPRLLVAQKQISSVTLRIALYLCQFLFRLLAGYMMRHTASILKAF